MIDEEEEGDAERSVPVISARSLRANTRRDLLEDVDVESEISAEYECGERFVFRRDHVAVIAWSLVLVVLLSYVGTIFLYRFAFVSFHIGPTGMEPLGEHETGWIVFDWIVDGLFWFDLVFNFFLAYEDSKGHEIVSMWRIAKRYLACMFWLNLLACLPEVVFGKILSSTMNDDGPVGDLGVARVYRLQRITRLTRLSRLTRLAKLATFNVNLPGWDWFRSLRGVRVVKFVMGLFFTCHLLACGWYLTAALHDLNGDVTVTWVGQRTVTVGGQERTLLNQGPFEQWLVAMYFVLTVFTTVGFGDISANTEGEIFFVVLTMFVGAVVHSIIISEVIQVVVSSDRDDEFKEQQLQLLDSFAIHVDFEPDLFQSIRGDVQHHSRHWKVNQTFDKEEMKSLLLSKNMPRQIISNLPEVLFEGQLCHNLLLTCCSKVYPMPPRLPCLMAIHLVPAEFAEGEVVFQLHDFALNLNLVVQGVFAYVGIPTPDGGLDAMLPTTSPIDDVEHDDPSGAKTGGISSRSLISRSKSLAVRSVAAGRTSIALMPFVTPMMPQGINTMHMQSRVSTPKSEERLYPYRLFGPKNYFGEQECLSGSLRRGTVRCERCGPGGGFASLLLLRKRDLSDLIQEFPQFGDIWAAAALRRESMRSSALRNFTRPKSCRHLAATMIQQAFRKKCRSRSEESNSVWSRSGSEALVRHSINGVKPSANNAVDTTLSMTRHKSQADQSHVYIRSEVEKMNTRITNLHDEMAGQRAAMSEVKETIRALLNS